MNKWIVSYNKDRREYLGKGGEEAARGSRGDFGGVDGGDHECVAYADTSNETGKHEKGKVGWESHEECACEEDGAGKDDGVTSTNPVGGSACEAGTY